MAEAACKFKRGDLATSLIDWWCMSCAAQHSLQSTLFEVTGVSGNIVLVIDVFTEHLTSVSPSMLQSLSD